MPPRRGRHAEKVLEKLFQSGPRLARKEGTGHVVTLAMEGIAQFRRYLELFCRKWSAWPLYRRRLSVMSF